MRVHIFDVEHGECNAIETPSGHLVLIGVGHNSTTGWRPSAWVRQKNSRPAWIILSNLDRDHLSDLPNFEPNLRPQVIKRNNLVAPAWVRSLKIAESGEVHECVETALSWMENVFTGRPVYPSLGMEMTFFHHSPQLFQDTNNLSVVTFLRHGNCGIMFPGDLECAGWEAFLKDPTFVDSLRKTNILVASHHGRQGGYCKDVFSFCCPEIVIISDKPVAHETQDHDLYSPHCLGVSFGNGQTRKILTTRRDGKITIDIPATGRGTIQINQPY